MLKETLQGLFHAGILYAIASIFFIFATMFVGWLVWDIRNVLLALLKRSK